MKELLKYPYSNIELEKGFNAIPVVVISGDGTPKKELIRYPYSMVELEPGFNAIPVYIMNSSDVGGMKGEIVDELPSVEDAQTNIIYLVPSSDGEEGDYRDEYLFINGAFEKIGSTRIDVDAINAQLTEYKENIKQGTGFLNREQCRLIFSDDPATLTIQAKDPDVGFEVSFHGQKYVKFEDSISIDWTGNRYIIYDDEANGLVSVAQPDSLDHIIVAYVYYNPDSSEKFLIAADERHQSSRNPDLHRLHHLEFGATHLSGGEIIYDADESDSPDIALSNIFITDEGLDFHIIHSDSPYTNGEVAEDILEQQLNPLQAPVLYLQQTDLWACDSFNPNTPIKVSSNNIPTFNDRTNVDDGYQSELLDGQFVTYFVATTNSKFSPVKLVQGSIAHDNADDCFSDEFKALGLPMPEIVALWQIAFEYNTDYITETNPYGIKIAQVRKPERKGGTQQSFGGQTSHALLSERNEPNQHKTSAIFHESTAEPLNEVIDDTVALLDTVVSAEANDINTIKIDSVALTRTDKSVNINLASSDSHGAMPKESFQAIDNNTQRIEALESGVIPIRISFTDVFSTATPTTEQITTFLGSVTPVPDITLVRITDINTTNVWVLNTQTNEFYNAGPDTVTKFQEGVLGGIVGSKDKFKVFSENDGTGSVVGLSELEEDVNALKASSGYASGSALATNAQISVTLTDIQFGLTKSSTSNQFSIWFANISDSSKVYTYHLSQQYGTATGHYHANPTLSSGAYTVMRDSLNYGGDCNFIGTVTNLTDDKLYEIKGEGEGNNIRIYARLLNV
jgi:hypothetical protein